MQYLLIQSLAILAFSGYSLAFYLPTRKQILGWQVLFLLIWSIHFIFLGAMVGAVLIFMNAVKSFIFYFKKQDNWINKSIVLYGFLIIYLLLTIFFWEGWRSLLPMFAIWFVTFSNWQANSQKLRWIVLPSNILWFVYNLLVGSYGGMIAEMVMFLIIMGSIAKHNNKKRIILSG